MLIFFLAAALEREKAMQRELAAMNLTSVAAERVGAHEDDNSGSSGDSGMRMLCVYVCHMLL